jgi:hypothetical protein
MAHQTNYNLDQRFDFTAKLKKAIFMYWWIGAVLLIIGIITNMLGGGHDHAEEGRMDMLTIGIKDYLQIFGSIMCILQVLPLLVYFSLLFNMPLRQVGQQVFKESFVIWILVPIAAVLMIVSFFVL